MKYLQVLITLSIITFSSCNDATTDIVSNNPDNQGVEFQLSGNIINPNNHEIPEDTKLVFLWITRGEEDEYRIEFEGTYNKEQNTFSFSIDNSKKPFYRCLQQCNSSEWGMAVICLMKSVSSEQIVDKSFIDENLIAYAANRVIIYKDGSNDDFQNVSFVKDWIIEFDEGFNIAKPRFMDEGKDIWIRGEKNELLLEFKEDIGEPKDNMPNWS